MLIMELAHARISGNGTLLSQYVRRRQRDRRLCVLTDSRILQYNTTKRWADYLVRNALQAEDQSVFYPSRVYGLAVLTKTFQDKPGRVRN